MVRFNELGSYSQGFGKNSSASAALETIGTTSPSCEELQRVTATALVKSYLSLLAYFF